MCIFTLALLRNVQGAKCIVSNFTVSGDGSVLANAPLLQTKAYWEISVLELGSRQFLCFLVVVEDSRFGNFLSIRGTTGNFCIGVSARTGSYDDDLKKRPLTW